MKTADLELDDDPKMTAKLAVAQKIGWLCLVVFFLAALLGIFGNSPLSWREVENENYKVKYSRFVRQSSEVETHVRIKGPFTNGSEVSFWMPQNYLEEIEIVDFNPTPIRIVTEGEGKRAVFATAGNLPHVDVHIIFKPRVGSIEGDIRAGPEAPALSFKHFSHF